MIMMKTGFKFYIASWAVLLLLFQVTAFVPIGWKGTEKYTSSFWIGYAFIMLAFIGNAVCAYFAFSSKSKEEFFLRIPLLSVSYGCLILSFIFGGFCMLIPSLPYYIGVILCAVVLAFHALSVIKAAAAATAVENVGKKVKEKTQFVKMLTVDAEGLVARAKNNTDKEACRKVYEAVRYSDPMSDEGLSVIEAKITVKMDEFSDAINANDSEKIEKCSEELLIMIGDRNRKCKALKA